MPNGLAIGYNSHFSPMDDCCAPPPPPRCGCDDEDFMPMDSGFSSPQININLNMFSAIFNEMGGGMPMMGMNPMMGMGGYGGGMMNPYPMGMYGGGGYGGYGGGMGMGSMAVNSMLQNNPLAYTETMMQNPMLSSMNPWTGMSPQSIAGMDVNPIASMMTMGPLGMVNGTYGMNPMNLWNSGFIPMGMGMNPMQAMNPYPMGMYGGGGGMGMGMNPMMGGGMGMGMNPMMGGMGMGMNPMMGGMGMGMNPMMGGMGMGMNPMMGGMGMGMNPMMGGMGMGMGMNRYPMGMYGMNPMMVV